MSLRCLLLAIIGETEDSGEGEALLSIRQTVVERILGHPTVSPVQTSQDLCPGLSVFLEKQGLIFQHHILYTLQLLN